MSLSLRLAKSANERNRALELRHDVLAVEEGLGAGDGHAIYDRFDCLPTSEILLAVNEDPGPPQGPYVPVRTAVGTVRLAVAEQGGLPVELPYDFGELAAKVAGPIATLDMFAVRRRFRSTRGLVTGLIKLAIRQIERRGGKDVFALLPADAEVVLQAMGAVQVGDPLRVKGIPTAVAPVHLAIDQMAPHFRELSIDPQRLLFDQVLERQLHKKGEVVVREDEPGEDAYLIVRGSVRVFTGEAESPTSAYVLGPGELFGELCLLDAGAHPGSVQVQSRLAELAVIPRRELQGRLAGDPQLARRILELLGRRIRRLLLHLAPEEMEAVQKEALVAGLLLEASVDGTQLVEPGWLASDCGLDDHQLDAVLEPWAASRALKRNADDLIQVLDPVILRVIADHAVDTHNLRARSRPRRRARSRTGSLKPTGPLRPVP